jgi:hypothetical protein
MEVPVDPTIQVILAIMATVAAIASAITAWKAQVTANSALNFQKLLSKHQEDLFLLRSTISRLWRLKTVLEDPLAADDAELSTFDSIRHQIRNDLEILGRSGVIKRQYSSFFDAQSRAAIVDQMPNATREIDVVIKRLEAKISEIFS